MNKRVFALVLCLIMAFSLFPAATLAAGATVTIGGIVLPAGKYLASNSATVLDSAPTSGGYAHRSADGNTLTLNDFELDYTASAAVTYGISVHGDIALELQGASNVSVHRDDGGIVDGGMAIFGDLTVTGDDGGSLTVTGENNTGIFVNKDLFVTSGSLTGKGIGGACVGVWVVGDIAVSDSGSLAGESSGAQGYNGNHIQCYGIGAGKSITVSNNGRLEGHFKGADETTTGNFTCTGGGIQANCYGAGDTIAVNGGTLLASAVKNAKCTDDTKALDPALTLGAGMAAEGSGNTNGANPVAYAAANNASYLWVEASTPPAPELALFDNATGDPATPGTDYTYDLAKGVLTVIKAGDYRLSMAGGVTTTSHRVEVVDLFGDETIKLTLDNVHIEGSYSAVSGDGGVNGALTIVSDTVLTLVGQNSLTNNYVENSGFKAYGVFLGDYASLELTGGGSLDVNVPNGTGIFMNRSKLLHISGGTVAITAKHGVAHDTASSGDEADFNQYKQSGGNVTMTAGGNTALGTNTFALSGGSLNVGGASTGSAINALYATSVSSGELTIAGSYGAGIWGNKNVDDTEARKGEISFTGGVTDITLGEGGIAIYSGYSHTVRNSTDTTPSAAPALPPHLITLGANMRVAEGGSVVWSNWLPVQDTSEVVWNVYDTFSTGEAAITITDDDNVVLSGFSNRARIEPKPDEPGLSYDYFITASGTVYNAGRTVWLTGGGLAEDDLLITERNPSGSEYKALLKLADGHDVFSAYNIYLRSGRKSTGYAMHLHFDLAAKYAGQSFTLVHQKADGTYEYFYAAADANGDLAFGPVYELSPFLLAKGMVGQTVAAPSVEIPQTGDSAQSALYAGAALIAVFGLAAACVIKRKRARPALTRK